MGIEGCHFKIPQLQIEYEEKGYAIIDLLKQTDVDLLREQYEQFQSQHEKIDVALVTTSHSNNYDLIKQVDSAIQSIVVPLINQYICNATPILSNFIVKKTGKNTQTDAHQDASFVDEEHFDSFSVWMALEDVDKDNGCMRFLERSHLIKAQIRPNTPHSWPYEQVKNLIDMDMIAVPLKAGQAVVFSHKMIHGSFANSQKENRLAAVMAFRPVKAQMYHYHLDSSDDNVMKQYSMTNDDFIRFIKESRPQSADLVKEISFTPKAVTKRAYNSMYHPSIFDKLKKILGG